MRLYHLNEKSEAVFRKLIEDLEVEEHRKIDNNPGVYMALHVSRLTDKRYSIAHYFEQNGDLMSDPAMEFVLADNGHFYPVNITQSLLCGYLSAMTLTEQEQPDRFNVRLVAELCEFAHMWFENIAFQQEISA